MYLHQYLNFVSHGVLRLLVIEQFRQMLCRSYANKFERLISRFQF